MLIVGLTGGIATGKSTVCDMLRAEGAYIVDTDRISRQVVEPGTPGWRGVVDYFGKEILTGEGTLDRKRLGEIVFASSTERRALEAILHPRIFDEKKRQIAAIRNNDPRAVVIVDIPLLIELGGRDTVDRVVLVYVSPEVQFDRLAKRDGARTQDALDRIASQIPINEKVQYADYIVNNEGPLEETKQEVKELFIKLKEEESRKPGA
jgi:dephospho-CoA kinase